MRKRLKSPTKATRKSAEAPHDGRGGAPSSPLVGAQQRLLGRSPSVVVRAALILLGAAFVAYRASTYVILRSVPDGGSPAGRYPATGDALPAAELTPRPRTTTEIPREDGGGEVANGLQYSASVSLEDHNTEGRRRQVTSPIEIGPIRRHPRIACIDHGGRAAPLLRGAIGAHSEGEVRGSGCAGGASEWPAASPRPKSRTVKLYPSETYERSFQDPQPYIDRSMCVPAVPWQTTAGVNCNDFHEVDLGGSIVAGGEGSSGEWNQSAVGGGGVHLDGFLGEGALRLLGSGGWRSAWELFGVERETRLLGQVRRTENITGARIDAGFSRTTSVNVTSVVLKMLKWDLDFTPDVYQRHRVDAVISGRMSSSPSVVDIYGFCGQSTMNEVANYGHLLRAVKRLNLVDKEKYGKPKARRSDGRAGNSTASSWPTLRQRIQYGTAAARALAQVHTVDDYLMGRESGGGEGKPDRRQYNITIAHKDIKPDNFVLINANGGGTSSSPPIVKLGDFNDAELIYYNTSGLGGPCQFRRQRFDPHYPSPEEAWELPLTPAVDVHGLGGVLFFILAGRKPFSGLTEALSFAHLTRGMLPEMPDIVWKMGDGEPAVEKMLELVRRCRSLSAEDRPSAEDVAMEMDRIFSDFEKKD